MIFGIIMFVCSVALLVYTIFKINSDAHPLIYYTYKFFFILGIAMIIFSLLSILNVCSDANGIAKDKS